MTQNDKLSEQPIDSRKELVERMIAGAGKPDRVNSRELIWSVGVMDRPAARRRVS